MTTNAVPQGQTGGQSLLTNNESGATTFSGNSTAAIAAITNNGALTFMDEATAGSASIINNQSGLVLFSGNADAGSAFIANSGELDFAGTSSAGVAGWRSMGEKTGSAGTSGAEWLARGVHQKYLPELWNVRTEAWVA